MRTEREERQMKKITKIVSVLALLFTLFAGLGNSMMEASADVPDNVSITLHKKKMTELPDPLIQNTGSEMAEFATYDDMPNVEFTVYDVTSQFYTLRAGGSSVDAAMAAVAANPSGTPVGTPQTTGANGQTTFTLPSKNGARDAVYVFVETNAPGGTTRAENMATVLPMYDDNDNVMENILLYPKNVVAVDGQVTITKKGTANNELLPDAEFIVSRELTPGNIEYLLAFDTTSGLWNWTDNRDDANRFITNGVGQFTISGLEHGDYTLIEVVSSDNASIIDEGEREFTISENDKVLSFYVYNDTIDVDKELETDDVDYNVGDLIPYSITVNIPEGMGYQFPDDTYRHPTMTITDTPDMGLQFNDDLVLSVGTDEIAIDDAWMDTTGNGFTITIPASALAAYEGSDLTLTYNMYLDGNADPDVGYNNIATVTTDELSDNDYTPDVFTGGFRFKKIDANAPTITIPDARFVVGRGADATTEYLVLVDHTVTWVSDIDAATEFISGANGQFTVEGLEYGNYWIQETFAPGDYVLFEGQIDFEIAKDTFTEIILDITNVHKGRLPSTGGAGILGIVGIGAVLVATTGGYYIKRRREE